MRNDISCFSCRRCKEGCSYSICNNCDSKMLSGDIGRSVFVSAVLTVVFGYLIPSAGQCVAEMLGWRKTEKNDYCSLLVYFGICFCTFMFFALLPRGKLSPKGRSVLITGCDTGFGLSSAKRLHTAGMHVFAGCLLKDKGGDGAKELMKIQSDRMHVLQLDVTSEKEVEAAVLYVKTHLPANQKGLWGMINNAGASAFGEIEWSSIELYQHVADVNLWGVIRCTKAFLPLIRRSKGRVVNMASGLARMMAPSRSVYAVTKFAIGGFSDCLRYEMKRWGVKVSVIEPGNYIAGTNIFTKSSVKQIGDNMWSKMTDDVKQDYGRELFDMRVKEMESYCNRGMKDLTPVLDAYEDALLSRHPLIRYQPMSSYWTIRSFIFTHFPAIVADYLYIYGIGK